MDRQLLRHIKTGVIIGYTEHRALLTNEYEEVKANKAETAAAPATPKPKPKAKAKAKNSKPAIEASPDDEIDGILNDMDN